MPKLGIREVGDNADVMMAGVVVFRMLIQDGKKLLNGCDMQCGCVSVNIEMRL